VTELSSYRFSILREGDLTLYRGSADGLAPILLVAPTSEQPRLESLKRLEHEYALRADLDPGWAARPLALTHRHNRMALVLEDPGGEPLDGLLGRPLEIKEFLRIAVSLAGALCRVHERNLIHKDIKPANVLADMATGRTWLTGFGIVSRLPREYQVTEPPEVIAGTLAYMAPEQTGLSRFPQRPLCPGHHSLRDAHGSAPVLRDRSNGVGALSHRTAAGNAP
jgi:serine/threonine protein kinase